MTATEKSFTFILIPWEQEKPIQTIDLEYPESLGDGSGGGDLIPVYLKTFLDENIYQIEATPLKRMSPAPDQQHDENLFLQASGVYAYHCLNSDTNCKFANIRATSLSMACGLLSQRFYGDVFISRLGYFINSHISNEYAVMMNKSISLDEIKYAAYVSPDLRKDVIFALLEERSNNKDDSKLHNEEIVFPEWILEASKSNYEDAAMLELLAATMKRQKNDDETKDNNEHNSSTSEIESNDDSSISEKIKVDTHGKGTEEKVTSVPAQTTLCLQCRRPSQHLCPNCEAMYFCESPRSCKENGWSHLCLCETWGLYAKRRADLSSFPFTWHTELMSRKCQLSDHPYESFLEEKLDICDITNSWWKTETSGWKGGTSASAKQIQLSQRLSYIVGFSLDEHLLPPERSITSEERAKFQADPYTNFIKIKSWKDYYELRGIPNESPVALLCTFPLTLYYAVHEFGKVPVTVSRMLKRIMRIHIVGVEKEMNFLDLFKEFGFLIPEDVKIELVFICREDMVPAQCNDELVNHNRRIKLDLAVNLSVYIQPGTFADTLDPLFDCGTGPPDMIMAFNAGLFAYKSWRNVINFLNEHRNVVAVFTDYNEHSGQNCASLGGGKSRESLRINPFRQPRAMPVYSMNLPQFSNGFLYVFNEQELDV